jgi:hypothetical protein
VSAPATLGAAAEAVIDLAHPHLLRGFGNRGTNLLVTQHVARTDDHDFVLANSGMVPAYSGIVRADSGIGPRLK